MLYVMVAIPDHGIDEGLYYRAWRMDEGVVANRASLYPALVPS